MSATEDSAIADFRTRAPNASEPGCPSRGRLASSNARSAGRSVRPKLNRKLHPERVGQAKQDHQGRIRHAALELGNVGAIHFRRQGERFLAKPGAQPRLPDLDGEFGTKDVERSGSHQRTMQMARP